MKTTIFQRENRDEIFGGIFFCIILLGPLAYIIYEKYLVLKDAVEGHSLVLNGGDGATGGEHSLLYIVNNKPYYLINIGVGFAKRGDCFELSYLENDPESYDVGDKCDTSVFKGKIIIHGQDYPEDKIQEIKVYDDSNLVTSLKFKESFALVLVDKPKIRLEYIVDGQVRYNPTYSFHKSPRQKIVRMDYGDVEDEINQ